MACGTFTMTGLDKQGADMEKKLLDASKPTSPATIKQEADGTFTVTAIFRPCPQNTTHQP
jgi:hypothetical protein